MGRVLLVGGGKMGGALAAGWMRGVLEPAEIAVVEPDEAAADALRGLGLLCVPEPGALPPEHATPEVVVYAVKPQVIADVLPDHAGRGAAGAVHMSVAAGIPIAFIERYLEGAVVRAMPNTPAAIGRGMTVACANGATSARQRAFCGRLLEAVGAVAWIEDEALMDAVTAVSGSGPAYVFLLAECLAEAGVAAGLPADLASRLAVRTVSGAGALLEQSGDDAPTLRRNVTSPGGTTEAALSVLMAEDGLAPLLTRAVRAAAERSRALAPR